MQVRRRIKTVKPENEFERTLESELQSYALEVAQMLNKGLFFSDNFNAATVAVADTGGADTEFTVAHSLKRIPSGYLVIRRSKAGVVYDSGTPFSATNVYLKCSAVNAAITVLIF